MPKLIGIQPALASLAIALAILLGNGTAKPEIDKKHHGIYDSAYKDLLTTFWVGSPSDGMWRANRRDATARQDLWKVAQATNALYGYWTITGSPDAAVRIGTVWKWVKATHAPSDLTNCGASSAENFASDDTAWNVGLTLESYEVTHDRKALKYAKGALDCAWSRWHDDTCGGGLWYSDQKSEKSLYAAPYALENYWYFQLSGDSVYRSRAIELDSWIADKLQRFPGTHGSVDGRFTEGLYWIEINGACAIPGADHPYNIQERAAVTMLAGNMAEAVLAARFYYDPAIPPDARKAYLKRIVAGARGIKAYEQGQGGRGDGWVCTPSDDRQGVFLDDRDGNVNGWAAVMYAREVLPLIAGQPGVVTRDDFSRTARAIHRFARSPDGAYAASWNQDDCWSKNGETLAEKLTVSGQTVNMLLAGAAR